MRRYRVSSPSPLERECDRVIASGVEPETGGIAASSSSRPDAGGRRQGKYPRWVVATACQ